MGFSMSIYDNGDNKIKIGSKVSCDVVSDEAAEVIAISDFDGDVDDDTGRSRMIAPMVKVRYSDGEEVEFHTSSWNFEYSDYDDEGCPQYTDATGICEDLEVVE
jgi:hypothetical protein